MIANLEVHDPETFKKYAEQVPATIEKHGGRYVVRGGNTEVVEGEGFAYSRLVIVEFDSMQKLKGWYESPEYAPLIKLRQSAAVGSALHVEGYAPV